MQTVRKATCACGQVRCEARGEPIVSAVCYCVDCQAAGAEIEKLPDAKKVLEPDEGTAYSTFRQDQWTCTEGADFLQEIRLTPKAPTTRYVAGCCNSAMFLIYRHGFWVSTYRNRYQEPLPPLEWRNKISARTSDAPFPDDLPRYGSFPLKLFVRLIKARIAQLLGR